MFAGIVSILNENKGDLLKGMVSKEGEVVLLPQRIKISNDSRINIWLKKIEKQMQNSIALKLNKAVKDLI